MIRGRIRRVRPVNCWGFGGGGGGAADVGVGVEGRIEIEGFLADYILLLRRDRRFGHGLLNCREFVSDERCGWKNSAGSTDESSATAGKR